jgi:hypothetical protein
VSEVGESGSVIAIYSKKKKNNEGKKEREKENGIDERAVLVLRGSWGCRCESEREFRFRVG